MITPEIKLRTFLICWFFSEENTRKQMLIKKLMDFSMYNTLATAQTWGNKTKCSLKQGVSNTPLLNTARVSPLLSL